MELLCWLSGLKLTGGSTGRPWTGRLPPMLVGPLTFQKGDLAQQQPVYQGRVGDGRQGDGTEAGAKEGLWLRVRCRLAIDCDGQGCEEEKRNLGRLGLAGCPFFCCKRAFFVFLGAPFCCQHHKHTLLPRRGGPASSASWWPKRNTSSHFWFWLFSAFSDHQCLHKLHCAPSPEALQRVSMMLTAVLSPSFESLHPSKSHKVTQIVFHFPTLFRSPHLHFPDSKVVFDR